MCALRFPLEQMTVEHAPQRSGQSRLGPAAVAVLTCQRCNNTSGAGFESDAAALLADGEPEEFTREELAELARQRADVERIVGLSLIATPLPFLLTDLKAAYIIAFAVLGYRWALGPELRGVRAAIAAGREPAAREATVIRVRDGDPMPGRGVVLEVAEPAPCVIVTAATGYGVMLPVPGGPLVPLANQVQRLTARRYPWPETAAHAKVNEVARGYRLGTLFHADLCHNHRLPHPRRSLVAVQ